MENQRNKARQSVKLILALLSLISVSALLIAPSRRASAQGVAATWSYTANLNFARAVHTATLLPNGNVLVVGGRNFNAGGGIVNNAEFYNSSTGVWSSAGLSTGRFAHTATLLQNGKVLVVGGYDGSGPPHVVNGAELYDPPSGTWSITGNLNTPRAGWHTATLLQNGKVLVAGGIVDGDGHSTNSAELYDPANGTWSYTGSLDPDVRGPAMLLPNGKVLVVGNDRVDQYDPITETWSITVNPNQIVYHSTATLLLNGNVLLAGGLELDCFGVCPSKSAELYDPTTGSWTSTGDRKFAGSGDTAMLLPGGKVLVSGPGNNAELYDPATETWGITANFNTARIGYTETLLSNGKVLVAGGNVSGGPGTLNSAELYDPDSSTTTPTPTPTPTATPAATPPTPTPTGTPTATPTPLSPSWSITGNLNAGRDSQTATLLQNGKVLVVGGNSSNGTLNSAELYDPITGMWTSTGNLNEDRAFHTATLLPNGKVLVAGGFSCLRPNPQSCGFTETDAELYDPATGIWTSTGNLNSARSGQTATLLSNGKVLVAGGFYNNTELNTAELYDPATGIWTSTGNLNVARFDHTSTLLPNDNVIVAGGANSAGSLNSAELYDSTAGTWSITGNLNTTRRLQTATLLPNGKVMVAGGFVDSASGQVTNSAELYDPGTGTWSNTGTLNRGRTVHTATVLMTGKVLVAGGFFIDGLPNITESCELYDPATGTWSNTASLNIGRRFHTATLLQNGKVLATGGSGFNVANSAELYDPGPTRIDDAAFFITQQYRDFLGREPEPAGLQFYLDILNGCQPTDLECIKYTRGALSANFFRSPEFQAKGSYIMYLYMVTIGQRATTLAELSGSIERPHYAEFVTDASAISNPDDRNGPDPAKKTALTQAFVQRAEVLAKYPTATYPTMVSFGNALAATAGVTLSSQTQNLIAAAMTRAQVLQIVAESAEVNDKFYKPAFVTMEYFGYLRRDPEDCHDPANWWGLPDARDCGYIYHNRRFNELLPQLGSDLTQNFIVRGFIESPEYRRRFGL